MAVCLTPSEVARLKECYDESGGLRDFASIRAVMYEVCGQPLNDAELEALLDAVHYIRGYCMRLDEFLHIMDHVKQRFVAEHSQSVTESAYAALKESAGGVTTQRLVQAVKDFELSPDFVSAIDAGETGQLGYTEFSRLFESEDGASSRGAKGDSTSWGSCSSADDGADPAPLSPLDLQRRQTASSARSNSAFLSSPRKGGRSASSAVDPAAMQGDTEDTGILVTQRVSDGTLASLDDAASSCHNQASGVLAASRQQQALLAAQREKDLCDFERQRSKQRRPLCGELPHSIEAVPQRSFLERTREWAIQREHWLDGKRRAATLQRHWNDCVVVEPPARGVTSVLLADRAARMHARPKSCLPVRALPPVGLASRPASSRPLRGMQETWGQGGLLKGSIGVPLLRPRRLPQGSWEI